MWHHCWHSTNCIPGFLSVPIVLHRQVAEETEEIQEFVRAADTPPGHAALAELHLSDLYSDFQARDSADERQDSADSGAASSQQPSGETPCEAPVDGQVCDAAVASGGQLLLPSGSADSGSDVYAVFSDGMQPATMGPLPVPPLSQNGHPQLRTGSGGSSESGAPPNPRHASLRGEDIYAAFDAADSGELGPQPVSTAPPAALPPQRPPQPPPRLLGKSRSSEAAAQLQARRPRHSSEQPQLGRPRASSEQPQLRSIRQSSDQLGRPRPSCDQAQRVRPRPSSDRRRSQQLQQRGPLANGHTAQKSIGAGSKGPQQPAPAVVSVGAQGSEATYAVYRKYHQAHPLPLPPPPPPLPALTPPDAATPPPVRITDATYDGEDAFNVYNHFADGSAQQRAPKAEDGSYAGEDAYSVYGRFMEEAEPAAAEQEHDLYTDFA